MSGGTGHCTLRRKVNELCTFIESVIERPYHDLLHGCADMVASDGHTDRAKVFSTIKRLLSSSPSYFPIGVIRLDHLLELRKTALPSDAAGPYILSTCLPSGSWMQFSNNDKLPRESNNFFP